MWDKKLYKQKPKRCTEANIIIILKGIHIGYNYTIHVRISNYGIVLSEYSCMCVGLDMTVVVNFKYNFVSYLVQEPQFCLAAMLHSSKFY